MSAPASSGGEDLPIDVDLIKVLSSDTRRDILRLLGDRRRTLTELAEALDLKKATILEHLKKLVESGLIRRLDENERLWIYYELTQRGVRLVRPGRTRFYLIMAGALAATLVIGAIVVVALSNATPFADQASSRGDAFLDSAPQASTPEVVWRGLDDDMALRITSPARANGTLRLIDARGGEAMALDLREGVATLDGARIDALGAGTYSMRLGMDGLEAPLPQSVVVRDPVIAVFPRLFTENATQTIHLSISPDAPRAPPTPIVLLDGVRLDLRGSGATFQALATPGAPGAASLEVGRLVDLPLTIVPDVSLRASAQNETLRVQALARGAALAGAAVLLDGESVGVTDAQGELELGLPPSGEHTLRARAEDGREASRAFLVEGGRVVTSPPRLDLQGFLGAMTQQGTRIHVEVRNLGPLEETITIATRDARGLLATDVLEVTAGRSAQLALDVPIMPSGNIHVDAYSARSPVGGILFDATGRDLPASETPAAPSGASNDVAQTADSRPDASIVIAGPPTAATGEMAAGQNAPAVPGPAAWMLLALVALTALALRRRCP